MPIHIAIRFCAREIDGIKFSLIGPFWFIGCAAMFKFITMQRIGLAEYFYQLRHYYIMEGADLGSTTSRLCPPIYFKRSLEEELGMFRVISNHSAIAEESDIHVAGGADE